MYKTILLVSTLGVLLYAPFLAGGTNSKTIAEPKAGILVIHDPSNAPEPVQIFSGVIVSKNGSFFVLRDDANNVWYHLDDQKTAGRFIGKKVLVTGTLDGFTATIRVQNIAEEGA